MDPFVRQTLEYIQQHPLVVGPSTVVVGVSGGLDSVVLLDVLARLAGPLSLQLIVAHLNHGLRGRAADADQRFVERLALERSLPFRSKKILIRKALRRAESIEMAARRVRHAFLSRLQSRHSATAIALAHHADDQVELFFLRLFRGSGGAGLGGMESWAPSPAPTGGRLIRPLLPWSREEIEEYARRAGLTWREDRSNGDMTIPRNRIRRELIPMLQREYCPGLKDIVLRTMDILRTDSECLEALSLTLPSEVAAFHGLPPEIQRAFTRQVRRKELRESGRSATFREITQGEATGTKERSVSETKGTPVPARTLQFRRGKWSGELRGPQGEIPLKTGAVAWELLSRPLSFRRSLEGIEQLDADPIGLRVTIRHWRPGDRFQPLGMTVPAKLQDLFVNRKVPAAVRRERHLATTEAGDIFWVEGFPPGELFKLTAGTKRILKWQLVSGKTG